MFPSRSAFILSLLTGFSSREINSTRSDLDPFPCDGRRRDDAGSEIRDIDGKAVDCFSKQLVARFRRFEFDLITALILVISFMGGSFWRHPNRFLSAGK